MKKDVFVNNWIILCICLILGIILLLFPEEALSTSSKVIAVIMLIGAVCNILYYIFNKKEKNSADIFYLIVSLIIIGISIFIFANPTWVIASINIFIGLILIINSIGEISSVIAIKNNDKNWKIFLIIPIIALIAGIIVMFNPIKIATIMTRLEGIALIINTISTIIIIYRTNQLLK